MVNLKRKMYNYINNHKFIIGTLISVIFIILSINNLNYKNIVEALDKSKFTTIFFLIILGIATTVAVAVRWFKLLHFKQKKSFIQVFNYINIGYLINNIFPARLGDFIRSFLWANKMSASKTNTFASVVVERLFDFWGLILLFVVALFILDLPGYIIKGVTILAIPLVIVFLFLIILSIKFLKWENRLLKFSSNRYYLFIIDKIKKLSLYFSMLRNSKIVFMVSFLTCIIWFFYVLSGYLIINDIHPGPFSWHASILSLLFISASFIIPSTPGNLGVYQYSCILAFQVLNVGYSKEEAVVYSLISQVPLYLLSIVLGSISLSLEGYNLRNIKDYSKTINEESLTN